MTTVGSKKLIQGSCSHFPWSTQFSNKWSIADLSRTEGCAQDQVGNYAQWWAEEGKQARTAASIMTLRRLSLSSWKRNPWPIPFRGNSSGCALRTPPLVRTPQGRTGELVRGSNMIWCPFKNAGVTGKLSEPEWLWAVGGEWDMNRFGL